MSLCTSGVKRASAVAHWWVTLGDLPFEHCNTISLFMKSGINWAGGSTTFTKLVYFLKIRIRVAKILSFKKPSAERSVFNK